MWINLCFPETFIRAIRLYSYSRRIKNKPKLRKPWPHWRSQQKNGSKEYWQTFANSVRGLRVYHKTDNIIDWFHHKVVSRNIEVRMTADHNHQMVHKNNKILSFTHEVSLHEETKILLISKDTFKATTSAVNVYPVGAGKGRVNMSLVLMTTTEGFTSRTKLERVMGLTGSKAEVTRA